MQLDTRAPLSQYKPRNRELGLDLVFNPSHMKIVNLKCVTWSESANFVKLAKAKLKPHCTLSFLIIMGQSHFI